MLTLVGKGLKHIQQQQYGNADNIKHINVSSNELQRGIQFKPLLNLITLVIDDNMFSVITDFPIFKHLETFSANKNNFTDLQLLLQQAHDRFGKLKNISLLKNPLNPFFEGQEKYKIYQDQIIKVFPRLSTLDGCAVQIMMKQMVEKEKQEENKYDILQGNVVYDSKYASDQLKTVKTRSEGHRFVKNNQL